MTHYSHSLRSLLLSVCLIALGFRGIAQSMDLNLANLQGAGRIYDQKAVIRWIPSDLAVWQLGNLHGYRIVRIHHSTVHSAPVFAAATEKIRLLQDSLRPMQADQWQILSDSLPLAKTAASLVLELITQGNQQHVSAPETAEDNFSMAMLLADLDPALALALGVGFIDTNIVVGEIYTYQVTINGHPHLLTSIECHPDYSNNISPPEQPQAVWGNRQITLSWKAITADSCYAFFNVERSSDGGHTFETVNALPILPMFTEATRVAPVKYTDSLHSNEPVYHYRIRGVTPFGQHGPPSQVVSGKGVAMQIGLQPFITFFEYNSSENEYQMGWLIDSFLSAEVAAYEIHEFTEINAPGKNICSGSLNPKSVTFSSNQFKHGHYYAVIAVDHAGNHNASTKKLFLSKDNQPPLPPTGLTAWIDTIGNTLLSWSKNNEDDIQGYRVYISNLQDGHYHEITAHPVNDTFFLHQYSVNTLQRRIYFSVSAIDLRGNYSQHARPHAIEIPDRIPPSPPVFNHSLTDHRKITICWIHSSSEDVINHQLQRAVFLPDGEVQEWQTIGNTIDNQHTTSCFQDTSITPGIHFKYRIVVSDASGNSNTSDELYVEALRQRPSPCLLGVRVESEQNSGMILLEWDTPLQTQAARYVIYSSAGKESLQTRAVLDEKLGMSTLQGRHFKYTEVHTNRKQNFQYQIAAKDKTGQTIDLSPIISITL